MTLEEKLRRNSQDDQIEIGQIIQDALMGSFGTLMRLIINGMVAENLALNYDNAKIPADRILGRLEELSRLQDRLEQCVDIKNQLVEQFKKDSEVGKGEPV